MYLKNTGSKFGLYKLSMHKIYKIFSHPIKTHLKLIQQDTCSAGIRKSSK